MKVKIDEHGFIYIQRGIIWRPQECKHSPRGQESCRDTCPLFDESLLTKNKVDFVCGGHTTIQHDIVGDDRMRRKRQ